MIDGTYYHTQRGPWGLMCYAFAVAFVVASLPMAVPALQITLLVTGLFILLMGASRIVIKILDGVTIVKVSAVLSVNVRGLGWLAT